MTEAQAEKMLALLERIAVSLAHPAYVVGPQMPAQVPHRPPYYIGDAVSVGVCSGQPFYNAPSGMGGGSHRIGPHDGVPV